MYLDRIFTRYSDTATPYQTCYTLRTGPCLFIVDMGVALITHITHVRNIRKKNIHNKMALT